MIMGHFLIGYLFSVGLVGALLIWWGRRRLIRIEKRRKMRVEKQKRFDAVKTATPVDTPVAEARETAVDSIETRFSIIRKLSFFLIVTIWLFALIFPFLDDLPAAFVSVIVAASGILLGIAARPFIENLIAGAVISFSQPIRVGDTVIIDKQYGYVEDIMMTHTVVKVWNWRRYIIPNSRMLAKEIVNCTINDAYQWAHVEFFVAYDSDIDLVKELAMGAASNSRYFADYEDPRFWVMEMDPTGYKCWVAAWADSPAEAWEFGHDIRAELIRQFQAHGIKAHSYELHSHPDHFVDR